MKLKNLEKIIFFLYIILLPFEAFHPLGLNALGTVAITPSFFLLCIGLIFAFISHGLELRFDNRGFFKRLFFLIIFTSLTSIFMSFVLDSKVKHILNTHTFEVIWHPIIYNVILIAIFYYVFYMSKIVNKKFIDFAINIIYISTFILGYIQIAAIFGINSFKSLLIIFEKMGLTFSADVCLKNSRVVLMFSEPSYVERLLCGLLLPFLLGKYLTSKKRKSTFIKILFLIPIIYFTKSSSVYIGFSICISVAIFLYLKKKTIKLKHLLITFSAIILFLTILIFNNQIRELLYYKIFIKPFDRNNLSTIQRSSVTRNCILLFLQYPLLGVGNGVQGFFYESNLLPSDYKSYEIINALKYENGVPTGGPWAGSWLSGYGLVGVALLLYFVFENTKQIRKYKNTNYYYAYIIGGICFLVCSWFTGSTDGGYLLMFVLTIPTFSEKYFCDYEKDIECI